MKGSREEEILPAEVIGSAARVDATVGVFGVKVGIRLNPTPFLEGSDSEREDKNLGREKNSLSVGIWYQVPWMCGSSGTTTIAFSFLLDDKWV